MKALRGIAIILFAIALILADIIFKSGILAFAGLGAALIGVILVIIDSCSKPDKP